MRGKLRGMGAELEADPIVCGLGTDVKRQVKMGSSEIDFQVTIGGKVHGLEVKGWTPKRWKEVLDAEAKRLKEGLLTKEEQRAVEQLNRMRKQLEDARAATGTAPYLAITDALDASGRAKLAEVLEKAMLEDTKIEVISEAKIKEAAAGRIGAPLGIPRP
jgi:hypothetical protein